MVYLNKRTEKALTQMVLAGAPIGTCQKWSGSVDGINATYIPSFTQPLKPGDERRAAVFFGNVSFVIHVRSYNGALSVA